ncbi:EAL domain-containing protein (putative c-di-GMP-specific phosphodiesterase class I) [Orenia metallireducens]|uniref:EAL domain, c-di-GMP-specific phosphodiesterase class I (Or its enzymatically inactive variant) n=1 Tax=Orenia metallireducens TaxID=1413210 RepID=A0A285GW36_9FIRM|nr:EAL domain-containing protein [Orenia metallireducens]PRX31082.1 EAL domain-containing protein (putative c-di-GMP-specific phosphodiesterase class I) [Orenia metallireducens]SNY27695.1 EAL domain, c-di-GMP-specific phosphodiesterase class I (or its enzymatically inactive variant) [Orenia metallireducens]
MTVYKNISVDYISKLVHYQEEQLVGYFNNYHLHTAVQPIFSLPHKRIVGYEALVRVKAIKERWVSPAELFNNKYTQVESILLDRLCRYLHVHNFSQVENDLNWLFLNVSPQTVINGNNYGEFFAELLDKTGFPPHRVVIEIVEYPISDNDLLLETIEFYRNLGCLIAIDDFGAGHSNFDRIWKLNPDIVKLDRSMVVGATEDKKIRNVLRGIVSLLHQTGVLVLVEGVETKEQTMIAMESGVDFVQGYFFAKPTTDLNKSIDNLPAFDKIFEDYKQEVLVQDTNSKSIYQYYYPKFEVTINNLIKGKSLAEACQELLADDTAMRCYLLMSDGLQVGNTVLSDSIFNENDIRFKPLEDADSADWFRRHYLRKAVLHPEQLQVSEPYLSITGAHMCVTISMMFSIPSGYRVLCCDLNFE